MQAVWVLLLSVGFAAVMVVVLIYSAHRGWCAWSWWRRLPARRAGGAIAEAGVPAALPLFVGRSVGRAPLVTVQLPMFNEPFVAERVIRAVAAMDWPRRRLQVQIIDDSTDHTSGIVDLCCRELRGEGFDVQHIRRLNREGYKAGALREAMRWAKGDLIAIFDADFVPPRDFLQRTAIIFFDRRVGMVQACWSHLNEELSLMTRAQALLLDGHFLIEHAVRYDTGRWFNFNGTAGVWRREAIEQAGSWESDTLTEDVDLSYRAQLAGWRFVLLSGLQCPSELPCRMTDLRTQQHRWTAGTVAAARKLLWEIWQSGARWQRQVEATVHLLGPTVYVALLGLAVLLGPMLWLLGSGWASAFIGLLLAAALGGTGAFYVAAAKARERPTLAGAAHLPLLLMLAVGLSVNNTAAAIAALRGQAGGFRRTPKLHAVNRKADWRRRAEQLAPEEDLPEPPAAESGDSAGVGPGIGRTIVHTPGLAELGLAAWCGTWAVVCATWWPTWWAAVLLALFAAGFGWIGAVTLREMRGAWGASVSPQPS